MESNTNRPPRIYHGPAFLSGGFRPMFLLGSVWAMLAMVLWLAVLISGIDLPSRFAPVDWHAHEMLYGFAPAVVCGFLLTAIPNWTGRAPIAGMPLAVLVGLWILGRLAVLFGIGLPFAVVMVADLMFFAALAGLIAREIIAARHWRNLPILLLVALFLTGNGMFHWSAETHGVASNGIGYRLGAGALMLMIGLIGGRVIPAFTRNWLKQKSAEHLPTPFNWFDVGTLLISVLAMGIWMALPGAKLTGAMLVLAGILNAIRLSRWAGWQVRGHVLLIVLHLGYSFLPLGYLLTGAGILWPDLVPPMAGVHGWMVGAAGTMMLAIMTRASRGHTGRNLLAGTAERIIFTAVILGAFARIWASFANAPDWALHASALGWIIAFAGFAIAYAPILTGPGLVEK